MYLKLVLAHRSKVFNSIRHAFQYLVSSGAFSNIVTQSCKLTNVYPREQVKWKSLVLGTPRKEATYVHWEQKPDSGFHDIPPQPKSFFIIRLGLNVAITHQNRSYRDSPHPKRVLSGL